MREEGKSDYVISCRVLCVCVLRERDGITREGLNTERLKRVRWRLPTPGGVERVQELRFFLLKKYTC